MRFEFSTQPQGQVLGEFMADDDRVVMIMGPLGSGKTIQTCQKIFLKMIEQAPNSDKVRPSRWYAVRNTYPDLMGTTVKDWLALFGDLGRFVGGGMQPPTHTLKFALEDGTSVHSELIFIALDREDSVKKLRGSQATGFWLNEIKELEKAVIDMADLRHGRFPSMATGGVTPTWHGMVGDTNAPDDDHWYYQVAEVNGVENWSFHRQPGGVVRVGTTDEFVVNENAENASNLPKDYYKCGMAGKSPEWIAVNLANEYGGITAQMVFERKAVMAAKAECFSPVYRAEIQKKKIVKSTTGKLRVWEEPKEGEKYVMGADVAEGIVQGDYSCADVLAVSDGRQVAQWHGHIDPDEFGRVLAFIGTRYSRALIGVENNNHGLATLIALRDTGYINIYAQADITHRADGKQTKRLGWTTTRKSKFKIIDALGAEIRDGEHGICCRETISEITTYVIDDKGSYNAKSGCYDDRVMSRAIAGEMLISVPKRWRQKRNNEGMT